MKAHNIRAPYKAGKDKWFYLGRRGKCSFHDGTTQNHVFDIPLKTLLTALTRTGLLAQWDSKKGMFKT